MSRRYRDGERLELEPLPLDAAAIEADDRALDALRVDGVTPAVSWDAADAALTVLAALHADVSADLPAGSTSWGGAAVVQLAPHRRSGGRLGRYRHLGRRTLVAGAVTATVLSASGVAAAAIVSGPGGPLYPIHKLLLGPEQPSSQHAAGQVRRFLQLADGDLKAGRVTAAGEALRHATTWLAKVDPVDRGDLPAQLSALQSQYSDALAAAQHPGNKGGTSGDNKGGAANLRDNSGHGSGKSGVESPGQSGDPHGKADAAEHGSGEPSGQSHDPVGTSGTNSGSGSASSGGDGDASAGSGITGDGKTSSGSQGGAGDTSGSAVGGHSANR
ncbi:MAG: hypothetical protein QOE84_1870 [Actinomycetota bacterium]|nr:hypothetical protein [Actinomycetota bacterium]